MSGLFLLAALAAIVYLMFWMVQNDGAKNIEDQKGLLRMTIPKSAAVPTEESRESKRRGNTVRRVDRQYIDLPPQRAPGSKSGRASKIAQMEDKDEIIHPLWQERRHPRPRP